MAKLVIEIDGSQAKRQAADLEGSLRTLGTQAKVTSAETVGLGTKLTGLYRAFAASAAVGLAIAALKKFVTAAMESEEANKRLTFAIRQRIDLSSSLTATLQAQASALQFVTRFEDESILKAQSILLRFESIDSTNIERLTKLTLDFAEATGGDAASAAVALGRALDEPGEGMRALVQAGIVLEKEQKKQIAAMKEGGKEAEAQSLLITALEGKIGGLSTEMGATAAGGVAEFKHAVNEAEEAVGGFLLTLAEGWGKGIGAWRSLLSGGGGFFKDFAEWVTGANDASFKVEEFAGHVKKAATAIVAPVSKAQLDSFKNSLDHIVEGYSEMSAASDDARQEHEQFLSSLDSALDKINPLRAATREYSAEQILFARAAEEAGGWTKELNDALADSKARFDAARDAAAQARAEMSLSIQPFDNSSMFGDMLQGVKLLKVPVELKITQPSVEAMNASLADIAKNFRENMQRAWADTIARFISTGKISFKSLWQTFKELGARAIAELVIKWAAAKFVMNVSGGNGNNASGWLGWAQKAYGFGKGQGWWGSAAGGAGGAGAVAYGSSYGTAAGGSTYGVTQGASTSLLTNTPTSAGATYGSSSGGGMSAGWQLGIAGIVAAVIVAVANHQQKQQQERRLYQTASGGSIKDGIVQSGWSGKLSETGKWVADKVGTTLQGIADAIKDTTGTILENFDGFAIQIRNSKNMFKSVVDGIEHEFTTLNEAMLDGVRRSLQKSDVWATLDPYVQEAVQGYRGAAEEVGKAIALVQKTVNESTGLTQEMLASAQMLAMIHQREADLRTSGLSNTSASGLAASWGVSQFQGWVTNAKGGLSQKEQQAQFTANKAIVKANALLYILELKQKHDKFTADLKLAQAYANLGRLEIENGLERARAGRQLLEIDVATTQAALAAVDAAMAAMDKILVDIDKSTFSGGGFGQHVKNFGGAVLTMKDAIESLREFQKNLVLGEGNPGGLSSRLSYAQAQYEKMKASALAGNKTGIAGFGDAANTYRDLYSQFYGSTGAGYANLFNEMNRIASSILTAHGIAPVTSFASAKEQADYQAKANAAAFKHDSAGRQITQDPLTLAEAGKTTKALGGVSGLLVDIKNLLAAPSGAGAGAAPQTYQTPRRVA